MAAGEGFEPCYNQAIHVAALRATISVSISVSILIKTRALNSYFLSFNLCRTLSIFARNFPFRRFMSLLSLGGHNISEIYNILRRLSLGGKYAGFHLLATAIDPAIAAQYGTSWGCVERNIRTAVSACWKRNRPTAPLPVALPSYPNEQHNTKKVSLGQNTKR